MVVDQVAGDTPWYNKPYDLAGATRKFVTKHNDTIVPDCIGTTLKEYLYRQYKTD